MRYALHSPVLGNEVIGELVIERDTDYVNTTALASAQRAINAGR